MKKLIITLLFILFALLCFFIIDNIFVRKDLGGYWQFADFYKERKNSIDVLMIGNSNIHANLNTAMMWRYNGMVSFSLTGSVMPTWTSYYYLKEALKYQKPKVILFDVRAVAYDAKYSKYSRIVQHSVAYKLSKDKIDFISNSSPKKYQKDLILNFPLYHSRYKELQKKDFFLFNSGYVHYKGNYISGNKAKPFEMPDLSDIVETAKLPEKHYKYLIKILDLAKDNDIKVLLVKSPYKLTIEHQKKYNEVSRIAAERGIEFLNFNLSYKDLGIDTNTDYHDALHMTLSGNTKYSFYISSYLAKNYNITDRRNDPKYASWNDWSKEYYIHYILPVTFDLKNYIKYLNYAENKNIIIFTSVSDEASAQIDKLSVDELATLGITPDLAGKFRYSYLSIYDKSSNYHYDNLSDNKTSLIDMREKMPVYLNIQSQGRASGGDFSSIKINGIEYSKNLRGLNIVVYDKKSKSVVDSFNVDTYGDPSLQIIR